MTGNANTAPSNRSQFYGRMFAPTAFPVSLAQEADLRLLGHAMKDGPDKGAATAKAGFTYFGQFIDHDLTYDRTSLDDRHVEPNTVPNLRTVCFDLEHIYGNGPALSPDLYEADKKTLKIGGTDSVPGAGSGQPIQFPGGTLRDYPRRSDHSAILADPSDTRNLENLMVMQIQVLFLRFHNVALQQCNDDAFKNLPLPADRFQRAQQLVRWHYQWLIRRHFLEKLLDTDVLNDVWDHWDQGRRIKWHEKGFFLPAEFALAVFRFGHSMVRENYTVNCHQGRLPLETLMQQTFAKASLPEDWLFEWGRLFTNLYLSREARRRSVTTPSSPINTAIVPALHNLPVYTRRAFSAESTDAEPSLPARSLLRGAGAQLPSGQEVAEVLIGQKLLQREQVLTSQQLTSQDADNNNDNSGLTLAGTWMEQHTPLFYYILKEAEVHGKGVTLGPMGSRIVAEVVETILWQDPLSYVRKINKDWNPPLWKYADGTHGQIDSLTALVRLFGDVLPQGCQASLRSRLVTSSARLGRRLRSIARFLFGCG